MTFNAVNRSHAILSHRQNELREVDPKENGQIACMRANGQGKGRARQEREDKARKQWCLLLFSTGELSQVEHAEKAGESPCSGIQTLIGFSSPLIQINVVFLKTFMDEDGRAFAGKQCELVGQYHKTPLCF